jgi:hypothetical protein
VIRRRYPLVPKRDLNDRSRLLLNLPYFFVLNSSE